MPPVFKDVLFGATLKYNETHHVNRPKSPVEYVGVPTPEMDAAWKELVGSESSET